MIQRDKDTGDIEREKQRVREIERHIYKERGDREKEKQRDRETGRQRHKERCSKKQTYIEIKSQTYTDTCIHRGRETDKQRHR